MENRRTAEHLHSSHGEMEMEKLNTYSHQSDNLLFFFGVKLVKCTMKVLGTYIFSFKDNIKERLQ